MDTVPGTKAKVQSGSKYRTLTGGTAIKDGIKASARGRSKALAKQPAQATASMRKPAWIRVKAPAAGGRIAKLRSLMRQHDLATVCEESHCPNLSECWSHGTATFMLMGSVCTRACRFCAVDTGNPNGWLDADEPQKSARSVAAMKLRYVVLTSVDRDDLADGGAGHFAATVKAIKRRCPNTAVEALTPDFSGNPDAIRKVVSSGIKVFAQNLETVRRLTAMVRDTRAGYDQTLEVLRLAKSMAAVLTKTSLLLGLGERDDEIEETMQDLRAVGVDILTLGQYLRPTQHHLPLARWVRPEQFDAYRKLGLSMGFVEVAAGPLVRSSYRADRVLDGNNLGLPETRATQIPLLQL